MKINDNQTTVDDFVRSYKSTSMLFMNSVRGILKDNSDLTPSLYAIMKTLERHGKLSQHDIARELGCSDATISRQVFALIDMNYVETNINPDNRRVAIVSLKSDGAEVLKKLRSMINAHWEELLSKVPHELLKDIIKNNLKLHEILTTGSEGVSDEK